MRTKYYQTFIDGVTITQELSKETYEMLLLEYNKNIIGGEVVQWERDSYTVRGNDGFYYSQYKVDTPIRHRDVFAIALHKDGNYNTIEKIFSETKYYRD